MNQGLMLPRDVPATEPPVGTIAEFHSILVRGAMSTGLMIRTEKGWSTHNDGHRAQPWEELTDVSAKNTEYRSDSPPFTAVHVEILHQPHFESRKP